MMPFAFWWIHLQYVIGQHLSCSLEITVKSVIYLARSAKLPTGLYILLVLISSSFFLFFTMSKAISVSTGPIFTIFLLNGRYLREFS